MLLLSVWAAFVSRPPGMVIIPRLTSLMNNIQDSFLDSNFNVEGNSFSASTRIPNTGVYQEMIDRRT